MKRRVVIQEQEPGVKSDRGESHTQAAGDVLTEKQIVGAMGHFLRASPAKARPRH